MSTRLRIRKTYKLYIGGNFVRSESGRFLAALSASGQLLDNVCLASRKDFRDAVMAARSVFGDWAKKTAYLRGQILYRVAEMLQNRVEQLVIELVRSTHASVAAARNEMALAIDRLVYYAGWTDKYPQIFSSLNPVASSHLNFTTPEPSGVVVLLAPDEPALISLPSLIAPAILSGNCAVVIASERYPLPAATFAEILATSDLPRGVVNVITGNRNELLAHIAGHMDVNGIVDATNNKEVSGKLQLGTALNLKRYTRRSLTAKEWFSTSTEDPYWIFDTLEFKTAWHPLGY